MFEQGSSTLSSDEHGVILDKIAGLEKVISDEMLWETLEHCGKVNGRLCPLSHDVMFRIVIAIGLFPHLAIRQVFSYCKRMQSGLIIPCRSALAAGRVAFGRSSGSRGQAAFPQARKVSNRRMVYI